MKSISTFMDIPNISRAFFRHLVYWGKRHLFPATMPTVLAHYSKENKPQKFQLLLQIQYQLS